MPCSQLFKIDGQGDHDPSREYAQDVEALL